MPVVAGDRRHPDRAWIGDTIDSLERWLAMPATAPTSQVTGGGAVAVAERGLSDHVRGRSVTLVPSATYGMRALLVALGIAPGDEVLVPRFDWPATVAAVRSVGAVPVPVDVTPATLTIDPLAAAAKRGPRTRAVVACHPFGIPADVPGLRGALPSIPVIEDAAQALGSTLDGVPVGALGDAAVLSMGPGKHPLDVGEAGAVVVRDESLADAVLRVTAHPARQRISGVDEVAFGEFSMRVHPLAAVLLAIALDGLDPAAERRAHRHLVDDLAGRVTVLGADDRRAIASPFAVVDGSGASVAGFASAPAELLDVESLLAGGRTSRRVTLLARTTENEGR